MLKQGVGFAKRVAKLATTPLRRDVSYLIAMRHFGDNKMLGGIGGVSGDILRFQADVESEIKKMNLTAEQLLSLKVVFDDGFRDLLLQVSKQNKDDELKVMIEEKMNKIKASNAAEVTELKEEVTELKEEVNGLKQKVNNLEQNVRDLLKKNAIQSSLISTIFTVYNTVHLKILSRQLVVIIDYLSATYFSLLTGDLLWTKDKPPKFVSVFQAATANVAASDSATQKELNKYRSFYKIYEKKWSNMVDPDDGNLAARPKIEFSAEKQLVSKELEKIENAFDEELLAGQSEYLKGLVAQFKEAKHDIEALFDTVVNLNEVLELSDPQLFGLTHKKVANADFKFLKDLHNNGQLKLSKAALVQQNFADNSIYDVCGELSRLRFKLIK